MATRSFVPRINGEGGIGITLKRWATGFINAMTVSTIRIETGAGLNKVLTSDADGDASWSDPVVPSYCVLTAKTTTGNISAVECAGNVIITNTGAGGAIELTLPAGTANYAIEFEVTVAQYLKIFTSNSEKFRANTVEGAANGYVRSDVIGTSFKIIWSGSNWCIRNLVGTLSMDE